MDDLNSCQYFWLTLKSIFTLIGVLIFGLGVGLVALLCILVALNAIVGLLTAVFGLGESGWWFLLALILMVGI